MFCAGVRFLLRGKHVTMEADPCLSTVTPFPSFVKRSHASAHYADRGSSVFSKAVCFLDFRASRV